MKTTIAAIALAVSAALSGAGEINLIRNPDFLASERRAWYCSDPKNFLAEREGDRAIVEIRGNTPPKGFQRIIQSIALKPEELAGKEAVLSFEAKVGKLSGKVSFAIREIDKTGKSLRYESIELSKYDRHDWKEYSRKFRIAPETASIALHITADYLGADDAVRISGLKLILK